MDSSNRKYEILKAIINAYIETGEPVGSRTLERKHALGISSATIRNEMADLEEMGYLISPHTSAGRVPSDKAYRLYVENFLSPGAVQVSLGAQEVFKQYWSEINDLILRTANLITKMTNYTAIVTTPKLATYKLRDLRLIFLDKNRFLAVIVSKDNMAKSFEVRCEKRISEGELEHVANAFLEMLSKKDGEFFEVEINDVIRTLTTNENFILSALLDAMKQVIGNEEGVQVLSSGTEVILDHPEFQDSKKAKEFIRTMKDKSLLAKAISKSIGDEITFSIGGENETPGLSDCSLITTTYKMGENPIGIIGVVGPTRMHYDVAVATLNYIKNQLTNYITSLLLGQGEES